MARAMKRMKGQENAMETKRRKSRRSSEDEHALTVRPEGQTVTRGHAVDVDAYVVGDEERLRSGGGHGAQGDRRYHASRDHLRTALSSTSPSGQLGRRRTDALASSP